jgi:hypothetical protein
LKTINAPAGTPVNGIPKPEPKSVVIEDITDESAEKPKKEPAEKPKKEPAEKEKEPEEKETRGSKKDKAIAALEGDNPLLSDLYDVYPSKGVVYVKSNTDSYIYPATKGDLTSISYEQANPSSRYKIKEVEVYDKNGDQVGVFSYDKKKFIKVNTTQLPKNTMKLVRQLADNDKITLTEYYKPNGTTVEGGKLNIANANALARIKEPKIAVNHGNGFKLVDIGDYKGNELTWLLHTAPPGRYSYGGTIVIKK